MRSLSQIFNESDSSMGNSPKRVRTNRAEPNRYVSTAGHVSDVNVQNNRKVVKLNLDKITSSNWNMERYQNRTRVWRDETIEAVPNIRSAKKQITDLT